MRTCRLANADPERVVELAARNLDRLADVLRFNDEHAIRFFRIHSGTVPFASHPEVDVDWRAHLDDRLDEVGDLINRLDVRISMHPGPHNVLNSPDEDVVEATEAELAYHARFLDALGLGQEAKVVLHVGGVYDDREAARQRFVERARALDEGLRQHLVVENDETSWDADEALAVAREADLPLVLDHLHHRLNSVPDGFRAAFGRARATWTDEDGPPIVHLSSPSGAGQGHHADGVDPDDARDLERELEGLGPVDTMLEAKDKERALLDLRAARGVAP